MCPDDRLADLPSRPHRLPVDCCTQMNTVANWLHALAYRLSPTSYRIAETNHHGHHRITLNAGGNRFVCNFDDQHPSSCDCE